VRLVRCEDQKEEAESIADEIAKELKEGNRKPSDYAICYRMNALSRNFEHAFRSRKIPFQLVRGLEFFNRKEVKDVLAYLRVVFNPSDTVALARIINEPTRGIGKTTMQKLSDHAEQLGVPTMDVMRCLDGRRQTADGSREPATALPGIAPKTRKAITQFVQMIDKLTEMSSQDYPVASLIESVLRESGYRQQFVNSQSEEDQERLENIEELLTVAHEFDERDVPNVPPPSGGGLGGGTERVRMVSPHPNPLPEGEGTVATSSLEEFLEQAALTSDVDGLDQETDRVSLMTMHAAKGLEFPVVYIVAIEENILPHERSTHDDMSLEEERRLFFVGITRAEEELRLSHVERRNFRGSFGMTAIFSRFLCELPSDASMVMYDSPDDFLKGEDYGDGKRLVREQVVEYVEYEDCDDVYDDDESPPPDKKQQREDKNFSLMTGKELLQKKQSRNW